MPHSAKLFNVDSLYSYEGYNTDFGPLTLNFVHKYITQMEGFLRQGKRVVHHCGHGYRQQANACFLMGCFLLISQKWSIEKIENAFGGTYLGSLRTFRDAGIGPDDFPLTVVDCLQGM